MAYEDQYVGNFPKMPDHEKKHLGLYCAYYAYLESIDRLHESLEQRRPAYPYPSQSKAYIVEQARRAVVRRLGLFAPELSEKELLNLRNAALRFTHEEQLLCATETGMYEELIKELRNK